MIWLKESSGPKKRDPRIEWPKKRDPRIEWPRKKGPKNRVAQITKLYTEFMLYKACSINVGIFVCFLAVSSNNYSSYVTLVIYLTREIIIQPLYRERGMKKNTHTHSEKVTFLELVCTGRHCTTYFYV